MHDFERHNEEVSAVWEAYQAGKPTRVPVILGVNPRVIILNPALNANDISFREYSQDPDVMARVQLETQHYIRHNLLQDAEMGLPKDGWHIYVDLQNYYEAAWFGAPVEYREGQVPDTSPILSDDRKRMLFDQGIPDPFKGGDNGKGMAPLRADEGEYGGLFARRPASAWRGTARRTRNRWPDDGGVLAQGRDRVLYGVLRGP